LQGVYHDGVGYYFLDPHPVVMSAGPQRGKWTEIEEASSRKRTVKKDVFSLLIRALLKQLTSGQIIRRYRR